MKTKNFKFKSMALVLFALVLSSNVWGETLVFNFEDDGAHRVSGNNSYTSNTYIQHNCTIACTYFDCVSSTKVSGSYNATGRVAKNTTNAPIIKIGPIDMNNKTITNISYNQNGSTAIKQILEYSTNGTSWTTGISQFSTTNTTQNKSTGTKSITGTSTFYVRISGSVTSSTSSNRDYFVDDITITYTGGASTYDISYSLDGGSHGTTHPTSGTIGTAFYVSAPSKSGYTFTGWKVTSGLNSTTAKWGTSSTPSTSISSSSTLCVNGATGNVYFKDLGAANASVTLTANWQVNKTISSIAVTTSPKTNYTTCEKLVVNDWKVTATYSDASTGDVTSGCTFSPANGSALTAGSQTVTVTHTASGKTTTKAVTVTQGARDTFVDKVQGTDDQYGDCNDYTIPSCGDKTKGAGCEGEHYKFIGWSSTQIQAGTQPTEPAGLLKAGNKHDATGATYYAVWAKEAE